MNGPVVLFADPGELMKILKRKGLYKGEATCYGNIRLDAAINFYFNEGQGDHNAQSDTLNLIRVANRAAQDLEFKTYQHFLENYPNQMRTSDQIKK